MSHIRRNQKCGEAYADQSTRPFADPHPPTTAQPHLSAPTLQIKKNLPIRSDKTLPPSQCRVHQLRPTSPAPLQPPASAQASGRPAAALKPSLTSCPFKLTTPTQPVTRNHPIETSVGTTPRFFVRTLCRAYGGTRICTCAPAQPRRQPAGVT